MDKYTIGCLTFALGVLAPLASAQPLQSFTATYQSAWDVGVPLDGEVQRSLTQTPNGNWLFKTTASALVASVQESSHLDISANQVIPQSYHYKRKVLGKKREARLTFDWQQAKVHNDVENKPWEMTITPGTQDKLSYQLQMRLDLKAGKTGPFSYQVADGGKLKTYKFKLMGHEKLQTPLGELDTIKVARDRGPNADRKTYIWFAPAEDYLIVQLRQVESDGKVYALALKSVDTQ